MNSTAKDCFSWSPKTFWGMVGALFIIQVGLILLFSDRSRSQPPLPSVSVDYRALGASVSEDQLVREFFVSDPAVFPLPNPHGFSGRGWLNQSPLAYKDKIRLEPEISLDLTNLFTGPASLSRFVLNLVSGFGTNFPAVLGAAEPTLSGMAEQQARREEPFPVFLAPEVIPTQSVLRMEGGLSDRLLESPKLRTWPSDNLLTVTVVQIAVNSLGEVLAASLDASSGLAEADAEAVAAARTLRFRPSRMAGTIWGQAVFRWQTTEPAVAGPAK
jgi:TonB family protein